MTISPLGHALSAVLTALLLAAPAMAQSAAPESTNPLIGCYSFKGADESSGSTIEERFRLTAEPTYPEGMFGPWQIVTAIPGERMRAAKAEWSLGGNGMIRVVWEFAKAKVLLQFPQTEDAPSPPVEGILAGPGPQPGVAQAIRGFVVRIPC